MALASHQRLFVCLGQKTREEMRKYEDNQGNEPRQEVRDTLAVWWDLTRIRIGVIIVRQV